MNVIYGVCLLCLLIVFAYRVLYMLNSKHRLQLRPDDPVSFPAVYGVNKVRCSVFKFLGDVQCSLFYIYAYHI